MFGHYESTLHAGYVPFSDLHRIGVHPYCGAVDVIWMALGIPHSDERLFIFAPFEKQSDNVREARAREQKKTWIRSLG